MDIGPYTVEAIVDGYFALDGGAMFGIVPRPLWERTNAADERHRIELAARCLLVRGAGRNLLVETGIGDKFDAKRADIFKVRHPQGPLPAQLEARGLCTEDITDVVLTHLHFDHCGGTTRRVDGRLELTYPRAVHHVQRRAWDWAASPSAKDGGSFRGEDFALLERSAALNLLEGPGTLYPGIDLHIAEGHTPAMQMVSITAAEVGLLLVADLVPTRAHVRAPYIMAYDNQPLVTLAEKLEWLPRLARHGHLLVFGHDPVCDAVQLQIEADQPTVAREVRLGR